MSRQLNFARDPQLKRAFLKQHSALIQQLLELRRSQHYSLIPKRNELAELARREFGYSSSTSPVDIVNTIMRSYKKLEVDRRAWSESHDRENVNGTHIDGHGKPL